MVTQSYPKKNEVVVEDAVEPKMKRSIAAWSSWNEYLLAIALIVSALAGILAAAIVGTAIHSYRTFVIQTSAMNPWWLPLWPGHFNSTGTKALIGAGSAILLLNFIFIVFSIIPKVRVLFPIAFGIMANTVSFPRQDDHV